MAELLTVADVQYQACFCEENVWHLLGHPQLAGRRCWAALITNRERTCAMREQRAAPPGSWVSWDYHAVLLAEGAPWEVWDLDSRLGCPVPAEEWLWKTFAGAERWPQWRWPWFRLIEGGVYRRVLSSDRSHMRTRSGGWQSPPPPWPAIFQPGVGMNLPALLDPDIAEPGEWLSLPELWARIGGG